MTLYKDALSAVPDFDGKNMDFVCFAEGCEEALGMIPPHYEENFVKSLRNKLKDDVRRSIIAVRFSKVSELVEHLRSIYAPHEAVYEALGKLSNVFPKSNEEVIAFANRVRELGKRILDAFKREYGTVSQTFITSADESLKKCFLRGLKSEISVRMLSVDSESLNELITKAIVIEKENDAISQMRGLSEGKSEKRVSHGTVHKVQSEQIVCQLCKKIGHDATECWSYKTLRVKGNGNSSYNVSSQPSGIPDYKQIVDALLNAQQQMSSPQSSRQEDNNENNNYSYHGHIENRDNNRNCARFCRYCRKPGHNIEDCRKLAYNNSKENNSFCSENSRNVLGNLRDSTRTSAPRGKLSARSAHPIVADVIESEIGE